MAGMGVPADVIERFVGRVHVSEDGCWEWRGYIRKDGYGGVSKGGRWMLAHRASYELFRGPIPEGMGLDHLCRVRSCVHPNHLEAVSQRENVLRSPVAPAAVNAHKTHCHKGHPLEGDNVYLNQRSDRPSPSRICKTCRKEYAQRRYNKALEEKPYTGGGDDGRS